MEHPATGKRSWIEPWAWWPPWLQRILQNHGTKRSLAHSGATLCIRMDLSQKNIGGEKGTCENCGVVRAVPGQELQGAPQCPVVSIGRRGNGSHRGLVRRRLGGQGSNQRVAWQQGLTWHEHPCLQGGLGRSECQCEYLEKNIRVWKSLSTDRTFYRIWNVAFRPSGRG